MTPDGFQNRQEAGRRLADHLLALGPWPDTTVLALPRGGVPVAFPVAQTLKAPLDVFLVRKLGLPGHEEVAMGALAPGGIRVLNEDLVRRLRVTPQAIAAVEAREQAELSRREAAYREGREAAAVRGRTVLLIDDGVATGATLRAGLKALQALSPSRVVVAVPVAPREVCRVLEAEADHVVCLTTPSDFMAVGQFYADFRQTTDAEVRGLLTRASAHKE
ncbi:phosphoribosyltransferase [Deinococcus hopiensis]|uniref:Predicted phosphoribosyltransferase n=1 Tax=Deinococcus hopiensis KR-140 TaxID=695939 RepID=A0A1W1VEB5_9DEIO|nr:phosphoribosyltransferase [Deinococcus hopiensis]SMB91712.1 Predicted phosphoribosyltransferase [Deinococcus hopiensis KR-140]